MSGQGAAPAIFSVNTITDYSSSDYNGFRANSGAAVSFQWNVGAIAPPTPGAAPAVRPGFATLAEYAKATRQDQNSIKNVDFRLRPGTAAIDRGVALPNINDGFAGKAPDLGALELGQPLPTYGPRR